ncbi:Rid family detoxifying hydrolase [Terrihabitans rhizophilus]|uniref:Rid family detoxifying hydrolase n=1 Tax=Terrihabitans rhizophilus TaxID=3092662 RepID=A0ABU4RLW8_9HYPH|nr:Rid family detoxifying hydrolase [Terrihabitans sp. PJ23]MDX6805821.1 Rid family detoxifying hydrolase [Terrihabitans sp. PJ23]
MSPRQIIATEAAPKAAGPYSQAIAGNGLVFVSGQLPMDLYGAVPDGIEAQTRQSLANVVAVLKAAGAGPESVVKTTVFLKDMNDFATMNGIYAETFGQSLPARSTIEVARLPRDVLVEIECIALAANG